MPYFVFWQPHCHRGCFCVKVTTFVTLVALSRWMACTDNYGPVLNLLLNLSSTCGVMWESTQVKGHTGVLCVSSASVAAITWDAMNSCTQVHSSFKCNRLGWAAFPQLYSLVNIFWGCVCVCVCTSFSVFAKKNKIYTQKKSLVSVILEM